MPGGDLLRIVFLVTLLAACAYAWWRGRRDERRGAVVILVGAFASYPAAVLFGHRWQAPEYGVLVVDALALGALLVIALRSERYWPIWGTAFQLVAVVTHLATMVDSSVLPRAYSLAQPFWAYPLLASLVAGTYNCSRPNNASAAMPWPIFSRR